MQFFILSMTEKGDDSSPGYDVNRGFVIQAPSADEARAFAQAKSNGDECNYPTRVFWTDPSLSTCEPLVENPVGETCRIVLRDYVAG